jgi:hypothetical protein
MAILLQGEDAATKRTTFKQRLEATKVFSIPT